jgi:CBS domain-containing protein
MTDPRHLAAPPEALDDDPLITQVMTTNLVAITPDCPLSTALRMLASTGVRHLPVLEGNRCRGIVLEADLITYLTSGSMSSLDPAPVAVETLTRPATPVPVSARRSDAARRMQTENTDAVLVTDGDRLVGIVTATDLIRSLACFAPAAPHTHRPTP